MSKVEKYELFADPLVFYNRMVSDIMEAKESVYLETFRIGNDEIGLHFLQTLTRAAQRGVEVKVLVDYWGAGSTRNRFFDPLLQAGGEVRLFEKIKINMDIFTKSHRRNHRKLLIIDDAVSYIGSSNLTAYNLNWRESVLRMESGIAFTFKKLFLQDYKIYNQYVLSRSYLTRPIHYFGFTILRDVPNITQKKINRAFITMIKGAQTSVSIETPYFLPGYKLRKALAMASRRGVEVNVMMPKKSDVSLVDILRNKYLGPLSLHGVHFLFYNPNNLHAKLLLIDENYFAIGSSNFDYRSFRHMFEIVLTGKEAEIGKQVAEHIRQTKMDASPFSFEAWKKRTFLDRFFEWLLLPFRHLL